MKKTIFVFLLIWGSIQFCLAVQRAVVIEDFESGYIDFSSYEDEDLEPNSYTFSTEYTASDSSQYSLMIYGNTWKLQTIDPYPIQENNIWQIYVYIQNVANIQGFGVTDGINTLFYSFAGTNALNIEEWYPVYQGINSLHEWHPYQLPIASDWFAWYEYYPEIIGLIYLNDADTNSGVVYFDDLVDISEDLPQAPVVEISYTAGREYRSSKGIRSVDVQFFSEVIDPDSDEHDFLWHFGDGTFSEEENPFHTYNVQEEHLYTVLLEVEDDSQTWGYASCQIELEPGNSTLPVTMNFAGDVMLARGMVNLISNNGIESIFDPTLPYLGNAAEISVINLESPLTTSSNNHPTKTIYFKGDPSYAAGLVYAGIDIVTLANNHVYDYMLDGIIDTQDALAQHGILYSGAGIDSYEAYLPVFYNQSGINIAFLASSDRTGQYNNYQPYLQAGFNKPGFAYMTPYYLTLQIAAVQEVADVIVIETHSGSEYSTAPGANYDLIDVFAGWDKKDFDEEEDYTPRLDIPHMWDIEIRHHMIDSGADIVICHHPHIIQGVEIYNGKLIAHSLGNFIFDLSYAETFPSMILNTKLDKTGFTEYSITPVYIDGYIPRPATGELGIHILDYLAMRSKELNTYLQVDKALCEAKVIVDSNSMYIREIPHLLPAEFRQEGDHFVSNPISLPRQGNISAINHIFPYGSYEYRLGRESVWFGNFEDEGASGWNINSNDEWLDDETVFAGEYSLCLRRESSAPGNVITDLNNRIKKTSEYEYSIHGYIKSQNGQDVSLQARYYVNRNSGTHFGLDDLNVDISGDIEWNYYYRNLQIPQSANFLNLIATCNPPATGTALAWFDNVGLIEWSDWLPLDYFSAEVINPNDYYYLQLRSAAEIEYASVDLKETAYSEYFVHTVEDQIISNKAAVLHGNNPNPFNPSTTISFELKKGADVELSVYNIKGQKVRTLLKSRLDAGSWKTEWNGKDTVGKAAASGVYFYQLNVNKEFIAAGKCLLLK